MLVLFAGIFVTMEPTLLLEEGGPHPPGQEKEDQGTWYHTLLYALAWLPLSFWVVWTKRLRKKYTEVNVRMAPRAGSGTPDMQ